MRQATEEHHAALGAVQARTSEDRLIARGRNIALHSAARLRRAATRAGGETGSAMACVLVNMILDHEPPTSWPVTEMIALLEGAGAMRDRQVGRLLASLRLIASDIDLAMSDDVESDAHPRAA